MSTANAVIEPLLVVEDLVVDLQTPTGTARILNALSFTVGAGETLGILGESGSGKSMAAKSIMGLLPMPPARVSKGHIRFAGQDLLSMPKKQRRSMQGSRIAMIFQDAITALNPGLTVGFQISEMFRVHLGMSAADARARSIGLMERVGIPAASSRYDQYPFEFSGGMSQRIMIAMAIALEPDLLIADEPTTALDVTIQAQILELLQELCDDFGMAMLLISHDLGVIAERADRVGVMYAGRIVEQGAVESVFAEPRHPYTRGLMASAPALEQKGSQLQPIEGSPPSPLALPPGCPFNPRCRWREDICRAEDPALLVVEERHYSACHFANRLKSDALV